MLGHPPLNTIWKGKVMLVYWERTIELVHTGPSLVLKFQEMATHSYFFEFQNEAWPGTNSMEYVAQQIHPITPHFDMGCFVWSPVHPLLSIWPPSVLSTRQMCILSFWRYMFHPKALYSWNATHSCITWYIMPLYHHHPYSGQRGGWIRYQIYFVLWIPPFPCCRKKYINLDQ